MRKLLNIIRILVVGGLLAATLFATQLAFAQTTCTLPPYVSSASNAGEGFYDSGGNQLYFVFNNLFGQPGDPLPTGTISICSWDSWYDDLVATNLNHDGAVKAFLSTQRNYNNPLISSFPVLKMSFGSTAWSSGPGIYEVAFDHFLNNTANPPRNDEMMIWTENHFQKPAGSIIQNNITVDGQTWDLWQFLYTGGALYSFAPPHVTSGTYAGFPSNRVISSGTFNMLSYFNYLISGGFLPTNETLNQLQYGLELVDTGGVTQRFSVNNLSIVDQGSASIPQITSLSPTNGQVGTSVTIIGTGFGATQGSSTVTFNGTAGTPSSWSDTKIVVPVPVGATSGNVVVTANGNASNGVAFTVTTTNFLDSATATLDVAGGGVGQWVPWYGLTSTSPLVQSTAAKHDGTYGLLINTLGPGNAWGVQLNNSPGFAASAGPTTISFWASAGPNSSSTQVNLQVTWANSSGSTIGTSSVAIPGTLSTSWVQASANVTAPTGTAYAYVVLTGTMSTGSVIYADTFFVGR